IHPKTVSRALQRDGAPVPQRARRGSKLDPYKTQVDQLLADGVWNGVVILRELRAAGYTGASTILRDSIAPKRALRPTRATIVDPLSSTRDRPVFSGSRSFPALLRLDTPPRIGGYCPATDRG
ncbi:MAG: hypothetical protein LC769_04035, partial [Chloroflexi bacterium]|nr:hypothetical protein [Chloroflexota bacterium]